MRCAGREIAYSVDFGRRRNMYITVHPDLSVSVQAPRHARIEEIREFVLSRGDWIVTQLLRYESLAPVLLDQPYVSGTRHMLHGRQVVLDVAPGLFATVRLAGETLSVSCQEWHDEERVGGLVEDWFLERAMEYLPPRLEHWFSRVAPVLDVECPELRIGYMKRCWGTSSGRGWVHLNSELVKIDPDVADYVIVHELCHLVERGHNKRFYGLVGRIMPDWRRRSRRLDRYVIV
jgi:predicted metal-dependent hydrolase